MPVRVDDLLRQFGSGAASEASSGDGPRRADPLRPLFDPGPALARSVGVDLAHTISAMRFTALDEALASVARFERTGRWWGSTTRR